MRNTVRRHEARKRTSRDGLKVERGGQVQQAPLDHHPSARGRGADEGGECTAGLAERGGRGGRDISSRRYRAAPRCEKGTERIGKDRRIDLDGQRASHKKTKERQERAIKPANHESGKGKCRS